MTLEELLECDAATLEAMSDAQLHEHFKKYFPVTRPELVARPRTQTATKTPTVYLSPQKKAALAELQDLGIDLSFMRRKQNKNSNENRSKY